MCPQIHFSLTLFYFEGPLNFQSHVHAIVAAVAFSRRNKKVKTCFIVINEMNKKHFIKNLFNMSLV